VLCCAAAGTPLGLMQDGSSGSMLLWSGDALHETSLSNEGKDMWRTYLDYQVRTCCCCCSDKQLHALLQFQQQP
jgi:hypothetical protein